MDILVIDDEVSLRRTLRTTLESMGHTVAEAASSDQALRQLQKQRFDLAVLDLRLGREAGLDLLPELLRAAPGPATALPCIRTLNMVVFPTDGSPMIPAFMSLFL